MKEGTMPYEKQIFVCTNKEGQVCGLNNQGEEIFRKLRETAKAKGFHPRIRIAQAKCLGQCAQGCNIMAYPSGKWYSGVTVDDVDRLAEEFFSG